MFRSYKEDITNDRNIVRTRGNRRHSQKRVSFEHPLIVSTAILIFPNAFFIGPVVWVAATLAFFSALLHGAAKILSKNSDV